MGKHPSAKEWEADLQELVSEAHRNGFCTFYSSMEEAGRGVGAKPVLIKLAILAKEKETPNGVLRKG